MWPGSRLSANASACPNHTGGRIRGRCRPCSLRGGEPREAACAHPRPGEEARHADPARWPLSKGHGRKAPGLNGTAPELGTRHSPFGNLLHSSAAPRLFPPWLPGRKLPTNNPLSRDTDTHAGANQAHTPCLSPSLALAPTTNNYRRASHIPYFLDRCRVHIGRSRIPRLSGELRGWADSKKRKSVTKPGASCAGRSKAVSRRPEWHGVSIPLAYAPWSQSTKPRGQCLA